MAKDPISGRVQRIRSLTLGKAEAFKTIGVEIFDPENPDAEPAIIAVREPSKKEKSEIFKAATDVASLKRGEPEIDSAKLRVIAALKLSFAGEPVLDGDGKPMREDVPVKDLRGKDVLEPKLDEAGNQVLDDDGKPVMEPKMRSRPLVKVSLDDSGKPERAFPLDQQSALLEAPDSGWFSSIADAAMELINRNQEDARKSP